MGSVGRGFVDVLTLGQSYQARKAAEQQQAMLNNMKEQQAQQLEELRKQGPAPTADVVETDISESRRQKRLRSLQAGLTQTVKSNPFGLTQKADVATPKATLGG